MRHSRWTAPVLLGALCLTACGPNWQPLASTQPKPLDPGQVVEFHRKDDLVRLHGVKFTPDSISGIPWLEHLSCDTCRVTYAIADVTQLRTGSPGGAAWWLLGPFIAIMAFGTGLAIAWSAAGGS